MAFSQMKACWKYSCVHLAQFYCLLVCSICSSTLPDYLIFLMGSRLGCNGLLGDCGIPGYCLHVILMTIWILTCFDSGYHFQLCCCPGWRPVQFQYTPARLGEATVASDASKILIHFSVLHQRQHWGPYRGTCGFDLRIMKAIYWIYCLYRWVDG